MNGGGIRAGGGGGRRGEALVEPGGATQTGDEGTKEVHPLAGDAGDGKNRSDAVRGEGVSSGFDLGQILDGVGEFVVFAEVSSKGLTGLFQDGFGRDIDFGEDHGEGDGEGAGDGDVLAGHNSDPHIAPY